MKKIGIIGGGSIGLLVAGYLCKANYDVTIYTNTARQAENLTRQGLTLQNPQGSFTYSVTSLPFEHMNYYRDDCLFIAVKQYHLKLLVPKLLELPGIVQSLVFLQNGMEHLQYLERVSQKSANLFVGIVEHGGLKKDDTVVRHTGLGELKLGSYKDTEDNGLEFWKSLTKVGFATRIYSDWLTIMEKKLIVNGVINPLTAIYRVYNGELVHNPYYFAVMRQLFDEIATVFQCGENDWDQIVRICKNTSENRSSMLRDIDEGRETEIEAITGVILEKGKRMNVNLKINHFVYYSVKGIEVNRKGET